MSKAKATLCVFIVAGLAKQNLDHGDNGPCHVDLFRNSVGDLELELSSFSQLGTIFDMAALHELELRPRSARTIFLLGLGGRVVVSILALPLPHVRQVLHSSCGSLAIFAAIRAFWERHFGRNPPSTR